MNIYVYKVIIPNTPPKTIAVAAESSTVARNGLVQQVGDKATIRYKGIIDNFMQVQGNLMMDGNVTITDDPPEKQNESENE